METFILYFAATGMVIGALMLLGSVGSLLYVLFFRSKDNRTASSGPHVAADSQSGHGSA
jgi:hypothetical protein